MDVVLVVVVFFIFADVKPNSAIILVYVQCKPTMLASHDSQRMSIYITI